MFTNLYIKTNYSLLSSLVSIDSLIEYAKLHNIKRLAICDDNLTSAKIFYNKCVSNNIIPIIGLDVEIDEKKILLYAIDYDGYKNLIKLSTIKSERNITLEDIKKYNSKLICIIIFSSFEIYESIKEFFYEIYIGVCNKNEEQNVLNKNLKSVFINKILYLDKNYSKYLKYLFMIRDSKTILDSVEFVDNYNYPLKDEEAIALVSNVSLNNSNVIASECNLFFSKNDNLLPLYDENIDGDEYLVNLSLKGLSKRLKDDIPNNYKIRLKYELDVIKSMGFSNYFLIVYDFIKYAKKNGILVGPGRGSAAGSLVAYSLGITEVDPLRYDLLFERFLNPERVTMPDIDTDFPDIYRGQVIDYVKKKYGEKKVSGIITFGTMASKLALRDVGRVLNVPLKTIDMLCKYIPTVSNLKLKDFYNSNDMFRNIINSTEKTMLLYKISSILEGFPRHISTHAAGVVMSRINLDEIIPLVKTEGIYVSGYTMEYLEEIGLLKMDFLGIKNLTTIMNIIDDIEKYEKIKIDFSNIPLNDSATLKIFSEADTCGIFQFESNGMRNFLRRLKPSSIDDIFAAIALFRPGPAVNIDSYINRKHGLEKIEYIDSSLEPILKSTYGIIIYQEQIMQIVNKMANFTYGEADILRRAMSKKKIDLLKSEESKFIEGSVKNGYPLEVVKKVYNLILNFANYGFNKSHSVCYSIVAYKMAYLKVKYAKYFFCNLLSSVIGSESKTIEYITEARKLGIKVFLPDIRTSTEKYKPIENGILFPISCIKNVGVVTCKDILKNRKNDFLDIYDAFSKIVSRNANKATLEALIYSSCFDSFGYNKATLIYNLDSLINYATLTKEIDSLFVIKPEIEIKDEFEKEHLLQKEKDVFGFYLSEHPTTMYKAKIDNYVNIEDISKFFDKQIYIVGMIDKIRVIRTKNDERMSFIHLSDDTSECDVTLFPKSFEKYKFIDRGNIVLVLGNVQKRYDKYQIVAQNIKVL